MVLLKGSEILKNTPPRKHVRNLLVLTLGSFIVVSSLFMFILPNQLLPGGAMGLAVLFNHYFPALPLGVYLFLIDIPLVIWAYRQLNLRFVLYTVYVMVIQIIMLLTLDGFFPVYQKDVLLACLFGGVIAGIGIGIIVKAHGSGGGMDVVGIILKQKIDISVGSVILVGNVVIVFIAALVFGFERGMYTMVSLYVTSYVFNQILEGFNRKRNAMIISAKGLEISQMLLYRLGRGVTTLKGEGSYSHTEKDILFCVVSRFEITSLKEIVHTVDPEAFVLITEASEVMGRFKSKSMLPHF